MVALVALALPPPWASVRRNEKAVCPPFSLSLPLSSLIPRHVRGFFLIRMRGRPAPLSPLILRVFGRRFWSYPRKPIPSLCVCEQGRDFAHLRVGAARIFASDFIALLHPSRYRRTLHLKSNVITLGCK